ncbi:MAG: EAL domain-containing protein [Proteobacteria bacterium]|nr:EAL domain-containing protein [Pseudomonadota bacterium]
MDPALSNNVSYRTYFQQQRQGDALAVSRPQQETDSDEWRLFFTRRLDDESGYFAGVAIIAVGADFFVSGYDVGKLGTEGVLGVIGDDGVFRARRTGDTVVYGEAVDYAKTFPDADSEEGRVTLTENPWDGVSRYTGTQRLYGAPLTVVVGLSQAEQLAETSASARTYLWRAAAATVVLLLVVALLWRMMRQLARARREAVTSEIAHARQVEHLAFHDGLTGLPNRSLFSRMLQQGVQMARRNNRLLAVLFLDLDRFKHINDTLGHEAGDQLLQEVAARLKSCLRDSDSVARLGGDEFVVVLPELADDVYAATVAQKIISAISRPFTLKGLEFRVTGSVGISIHPQDGLDEETLTKNADIAMYKAKAEGKNTFQFYSDTFNAESLERLTLESSLRRALENNEFEIHYQAKSDLKTGQITGMEALLRWQHPDLGTVAPMRFIPVAEQTGLIVPIGRWVLKTVCLQNLAWQKEGLSRLHIAVNLSELQFFDEHLLHDVETILESTGMEADLLEFEITEGMLMRDVQRTLRVLTALKKLGVRIAVDDFGLGYTTLASLRQFPIDTIKIDRSLIRGVTHVADDQALTEAIIAMGKSLSMTVVAQGVENTAQAKILREDACDEIQGFYFDRPVPAAQFAQMLRARAALAPDIGTGSQPVPAKT